MYNITIVKTRCKNDGMCTRVCPAEIIAQQNKLTIPELLNEKDCITCSHRVAICPQGSICHFEFPSTGIRTIQAEEMPATEQMITLLKSRRSIRVFRDTPLEKETIERIIDGHGLPQCARLAEYGIPGGSG